MMATEVVGEQRSEQEQEGHLESQTGQGNVHAAVANALADDGERAAGRPPAGRGKKVSGN